MPDVVHVTILTPSNDVEHQDDESNDTSTGTCLPWLSTHGRNRRSLCKHGEGELEESGDDEVEHDGRLLELLACDRYMDLFGFCSCKRR